MNISQILAITCLVGSASFAQEKSDSKPATPPPEKMQEYCKKHPTETMCKPTQVKQKMNSIIDQKIKSTDQKLQELEE